MHKYFIKTPWIVRQWFSSYEWRVPVAEKVVYLTFDDGPHPSVTPWVLEQLRLFGAKATFFCVGNNVELYGEVYRQVIEEGHRVGNHTYDHPNGWEMETEPYLDNIRKAAALIDSDLFRPPYGRIKRSQARKVAQALARPSARIIMWDVLSADFDPLFSVEQCLANVLKNYQPGSIIVFHDSEKAFPNLKPILPKVLEELKREGYTCKALN